MVRRVSLKGLYGRVRLQGQCISRVCPGGGGGGGGTKYSAVDSPGGPLTA